MKINPEEFNNMKYKTVKTCVNAIIERDGKVLITKRSDELIAGNKWCLPGGHIDIGETSVQAIKREVKEEVNTNLENPQFLFYEDEIIYEIKNHSVTLIFKDTTKENASLSQEVKEVAWINKEDLGNYEFAFYTKKILERYWGLK